MTAKVNWRDQIALGSSGPVHLFEPETPNVPIERVLRLQGYRDLSRVRKTVYRACERAVEEANTIAAPTGCFRVVAVASLIDSRLTLALKPTVTLTCPAFDQHLGDSDYVVVYALTAGSTFDARVTGLQEADELLHGLLLESAAWLVVEAVTRQFVVWLRDNAKTQARRITRRLGPGYQYRVGETSCEWALEEQQLLFKTFLNATIPVTLMESSAMLPKMSRSGLIGIRRPTVS